jgi:hypothetical protein
MVGAQQLTRDRLLQEIHRAERKSAPAVVRNRDHQHRNVAQPDVALQLLQDGPAVDPGQLQVEQDRRRPLATDAPQTAPPSRSQAIR